MSTTAGGITFPRVFHTGVLPADTTELEAKADLYSGWAGCLAGAKPPKKFGYGVVAIHEAFPALIEISLNIGKPA